MGRRSRRRRATAAVVILAMHASRIPASARCKHLRGIVSRQRPHTFFGGRGSRSPKMTQSPVTREEEEEEEEKDPSR